MPCITHHYACECRERRMGLLEAVAKAATQYFHLDKEEGRDWNPKYFKRYHAVKIAVEELEKG